ncbi:MAG: hypothetical protein FJW38_29040 [Acidobacteria bacterium]|nr:hypothetical protein [Acidobacteriota bacterium]
MVFEFVELVTHPETIAVRHSIRDLARFRRLYGQGRWRKLKAVANVELADGRIRLAEVHWYEAHGIGKREPKIKRFLY